MEINELIELCKNLPGAWEDRPFGPEHAVMKVGKKLFAIISDESGLRINLKSDPDFAITLREQYDFIIPGYHMNKKHWNTVLVFKMDNVQLLTQLVNDSYNLVLNSLTKKEQKEIKGGK